MAIVHAAIADFQKQHRLTRALVQLPQPSDMRRPCRPQRRHVRARRRLQREIRRHADVIQITPEGDTIHLFVPVGRIRQLAVIDLADVANEPAPFVGVFPRHHHQFGADAVNLDLRIGGQTGEVQGELAVIAPPLRMRGRVGLVDRAVPLSAAPEIARPDVRLEHDFHAQFMHGLRFGDQLGIGRIAAVDAADMRIIVRLLVAERRHRHTSHADISQAFQRLT